MSKQAIATDKAPSAVGPYSQGIKANGLVFVSGQVAFIPGTKNLVEGGIKEQTERVLNNVRIILEAGGSSLENVVKTTVFLSDISNFAAMNETYATFFPTNPPARSTVQAVLPRPDALVEIEVVALA